MSPRPLGDKRVAHGGASRTSWGVCPAGLERRREGEAALGTSGSSGSQGQWCWGRLLSILPRELALDRSAVLSLTLLLIDSDLPQKRGCNFSVCFTLLAALRIESSQLFCSVNDCPIFYHVVLTVWHWGTLGKTKPG